MKGDILGYHPAIVVALEQGSFEWLAWRANRYTASSAPAVMGCNPWFPRTPVELYQQRTGQRDVRVTAAMRAGNADEPRACALLAQKLGMPELAPACIEREIVGLQFGASYDAINGDHSMAFEIKRPQKGSSSDLWNAPVALPHYRWQMVHQLMCQPALNSVSLVAYAHDLDEVRIIDFIQRDAAHSWIQELLAAWVRFDDQMTSFTMPARLSDDVVDLTDDPHYAELVDAWKQAHAQHEACVIALNDAKQLLLDYAAENGMGLKVSGCGATIFETERKGAVDWKAKPITAALLSAGVNPDDHRAASTTYWSIRGEK